MFKFKWILSFLYIFLFTGFILGTITLNLVVENFVAYSRQTGWLNQYENAIVIGMIVLYLIYSFLFALWLTSVFLKLSNKIKKFIFLSILTGLTGFTLWDWLNPKSNHTNMNYTQLKKNFIHSNPLNGLWAVGEKNQNEKTYNKIF